MVVAVKLRALKKLRRWANGAATHSGRTLMAPDIHIDEIDPAYKDVATWWEGGLACFRAARTIRDEMSSNDVVALIFDVGHRPLRNPTSITSAVIRQKHTMTPPEIMWLRKATKTRYLKYISGGQRLDHLDHGIADVVAFYFEYTSLMAERSCTVWLMDSIRYRLGGTWIARSVKQERPRKNGRIN